MFAGEAGVAHPMVVLASLRPRTTTSGVPGGRPARAGSQRLPWRPWRNSFASGWTLGPMHYSDSRVGGGRFYSRERAGIAFRRVRRAKKQQLPVTESRWIHSFIYLFEILGDVLFFFLPFNPINFPDVFFRCQMSGSEAVKACTRRAWRRAQRL